jgi:uncharacterized protein YjiS (DUF1127 family)
MAPAPAELKPALKGIATMVSQLSPYRSAAALFQTASALYAVATRMRFAARKLHVWLDGRRIAADARRDLKMMSERELKDIGLTRVDIDRVALGASDRTFHTAGAHFDA